MSLSEIRPQLGTETSGRQGRKKIKPKKPSNEWEAGAVARSANVQLHENPFPQHSSKSYRWREGWEYEDQEIGTRR